MRIKRLLFGMLTLLPLIITLVVLPMLPAQIPAQFDSAGNVTRFGSRYETLIVPVIVLGTGFFSY